MRTVAAFALAVLVPAGTFAQNQAPVQTQGPTQATPAVQSPAQGTVQVPVPPRVAPAQPIPREAGAGAAVPPDYVIGPDDVLGVVFWEQANHGGDVIVRPDGKITLPLINDVQAAGLTPDQLRQAIVTASAKFLRDPNVSVIVKQTNSRRVYVTGRVNKPGTYIITTPVTVLQMLALAGGIADFAKKDRIVVMRTEGERTESYKFNYKNVTEGKQLEQNILLKPGDTVIVP